MESKKDLNDVIETIAIKTDESRHSCCNSDNKECSSCQHEHNDKSDDHSHCDCEHNHEHVHDYINEKDNKDGILLTKEDFDAKKAKMNAGKKKDTRTARLITMMVFVIGYMLAEIIVGIVGHSLALLGDGFHMLSDSVSLIIGAASIRYGKKSATNKFSYGFKRAETIGSFFNGSYLLATAIFLFTEIISRYLEGGEGIKDDEIDLVLYVGIGGIVINIIGLFLFHEHGEGEEHHHHHCGKKHSHEHEHEHEHERECHYENIKEDEHHHHHNHEHEHHHDNDNENDLTIINSDVILVEEQNTPKKNKKSKKQDLLTASVFFHVVSDFLGSVVAIIAALVQKFTTIETFKYRGYVDPTCSLLLVCFLLGSSIPLLKKAIYILMQGVPTEIKTEEIKKEIEKVPGVIGVHDIHIWQYSAQKIIANIHIVTRHDENKKIDVTEYRAMVLKLKQIFHAVNVHALTIQIEPIDSSETNPTYCFQPGSGCNKREAWCCENVTVKIVN